jgi:hypothetical protein
MNVAIGKRSEPADLSLIVDENRFVQYEVRGSGNKSIEVD